MVRSERDAVRSGELRRLTVVDLFSGRAAANPGAPAVAWPGGSLTYHDLDRRARALAAELGDLGVTAESPVALLTGRSPELIVGALGVLLAGGAYLPLDPHHPEERLAWMLENAGVGVVVVDPSRRDGAPARSVVLDAGLEPGGKASGALSGGPVPLDPARLAYTIFTSGSTGRPKGVEVSHGALANLSAWHRRAFGIGPDDRASVIAGVGFDASVWEIWPYLSAGASLSIAPEPTRSDPAALRDWLLAEGITVAFVPTPLAEGLIRLPWPDGGVPLRYLLTGGDRLRRWPAPGLPFRLINAYGPTEGAVVATSGEVPPRTEAPVGAPAIGRAIDGVTAEVVGPGLEPLAAGREGELVTGGDSLARGYLGQPAKTAEAFVPDPSGRRSGGRIYRTGDLCRVGDSGEIEFLGRFDRQVKVRGHRIELGEIETVLTHHPGVREAVVTSLEGPAGYRLVGYVVSGAEGPEELSSATLREYLGRTLPAPMVPGLFVHLDALPLTPNGKIDRAALPVPVDSAEPAPPSTATESYLVELLQELFGHGAIGVDSDFFELGGHSLIVAQLCARVREHLAVELDPRAIFDLPTVALLAEHVDRSEPGDPLPPIEPADRNRDLRLSFAQERVWFLQELVPDTLAYNSQLTLRFRGPLVVDRLADALEEIVRRHEILRTTFEPGPSGDPVQRIHPPHRLELPVVDLREHPPGEREARLTRRIQEEIGRPFRLDRLPLVRWIVYRLSEEEHVLLQVEHHFLHDGWGVSAFLRELQEIYPALLEGRDHRLEERPIQYADFALWQRDWLRGEALERLLSYWRGRLRGAPPVLELPTDRPRPESPTFDGDALELVLPQHLYDGVREVGRRHGWTLFVTMLSAMYALLERITGQSDLVLGSGMANRRLRELEGMIGMVVNTVVLRTDLAGDPTVRELRSRVRETVLEAHVHQDLPFEKLVEDLRPDRDPRQNPLVQTLFSFHDAPVPDLRLGDLEGTIRYLNNGTAKTDLNVIGIPRAEQRRDRAGGGRHRMAFLWEYSRDVFDRTTMLRMWRQYLHLLEAMLARPEGRLSELPLLSASERAQTLVEWNDTATPYPAEATIDRLVAEQARRRGDAVAVTCDGAALTYAELDARAGRLAARLRGHGVGPEVPVALLVDRSLDMVVALLAVLEAGGAYVALDPASPAARQERILREVAPPVVITRAGLEARLPEVGAARIVLGRNGTGEGTPAPEPGPAPPVRQALADGLAYVMYTSGSTGRPKGVAVSHRNVVRLVRESREIDLSPERTFLQFAPVSFDASTLEIWGPIVNGGRLVVFPAGAASLDELARRVARERVDTLWLTAGLFHQLDAGHLERFGSVRQLLAGGDVLRPGVVRRVAEALPAATLIDGYGPTENTTFTCCHRMTGPEAVASPVPIGRPIADTTAHLVDRLLRPVPPRSVGELMAGGDGVARGYFAQPRLTAERFLPDPWAGRPGGRLYATGDLARRAPDGRIDFVGRRDLQVKVRGFRVELGEIESVLESHPGVREAVVAAPQDPFGDRRLVAHTTPAGDDGPREDELRAFCRNALPEYLVPAAFVRHAAFPLDPNGKVDRKALPELVPSPDRGNRYEAPETESARFLADLWERHLEVERVGLHDDFFDLGGHSLLAIRILTRIREEMGVELSLQDFLDAGCISRLDERIETLQLETAGEDLVADLLGRL